MLLPPIYIRGSNSNISDDKNGGGGGGSTCIYRDCLLGSTPCMMSPCVLSQGTALFTSSTTAMGARSPVFPAWRVVAFSVVLVISVLHARRHVPPIQDMRFTEIFQETNWSIQMLENFMNRSLHLMRSPLRVMQRAYELVWRNIEDVVRSGYGANGEGTPAPQAPMAAYITPSDVDRRE